MYHLDKIAVSEVAPPSKFDMWYNPTDNELRINVNGIWKVVSACKGSDGDPTTPEDLEAKDIAYDDPRYDTVDSALDDILDQMNYVKPQITSFTVTPTSLMYEVGQTVPRLDFRWAINKSIASQTLTGVSNLSALDRQAAFKETLSQNKTFTLSVTDAKGASNAKSISINFGKRVYYGGKTQPSSYDQDFIKSLGSKLVLAKKGSYNMNVATGNYAYICIPNSWGDLGSLTIGAFSSYVWEKVASADVTNDYGISEQYDIYKSPANSLGNITVIINN